MQSGAQGCLPILYALGSVPICVNTGASASISNCKEDFVHLTPISNLHLHGIATGLPIAGIGTLQWTITTDSGVNVALTIQKVLYVPKCPMNLLSPQQLAQQTKCSVDGFTALATIGILKFASHQRSVLLEPSSNLPILHTVGVSSTTIATLHEALVCAFHTRIDNLTEVQKQLLHVHHRLGHLGFGSIQALARSGLLPKQLASCPKPLCSSCQFGKAH